jgi:hypothetical protein
MKIELNFDQYGLIHSALNAVKTNQFFKMGYPEEEIDALISDIENQKEQQDK